MDPAHFGNERALPSSSTPVPLLVERELAGSLSPQRIDTSAVYRSLAVTCKTLGHHGAVHCVLYDVTGQYIFTTDTNPTRSHSQICDLSVNYDNSLLAAGTYDTFVRVWCLRTSKLIAALNCRTGIVTSVNFCNESVGTIKYLASTNVTGTFSFWKLKTNSGQPANFGFNPVKFMSNNDARAVIYQASFSPGGMFLATGSADARVRVYATFYGAGPVRILEQFAHQADVNCIQWANKGLRFISGSKDGTVIVWHGHSQEWQTFRLRMNCQLERDERVTANAVKVEVTMATWSRDDCHVITVLNDFSVKVWDSWKGVLLHELKRHVNIVFTLAPHPHDANVFFSAGCDGQLVIWDISKGTTIKSFKKNDNERNDTVHILDAKWNPQGSKIAATDAQGHVILYGTDPYPPDPQRLVPQKDRQQLVLLPPLNDMQLISVANNAIRLGHDEKYLWCMDEST